MGNFWSKGDKESEQQTPNPAARQRRVLQRRVPLLTPLEVPDAACAMQGLGWFADTMKLDEDGDSAHDFLEVDSETLELRQVSPTRRKVAAPPIQTASATNDGTSTEVDYSDVLEQAFQREVDYACAYGAGAFNRSDLDFSTY